jgi:hypothetical protein
LPLALSLASPPGASETVGIAWQHQATADATSQQRLLQTIATALGAEPDAVIPDAVGQARRMVAHELPRAGVLRLIELGERLEDAGTRYRGGELDAAHQGAAEVLEALRADPVLPGASRLAWRAHLLRARVAWTRADDVATREALHAAVCLDPEAKVTTRRVPPAFASIYAEVQQSVLAAKAEWQPLRIRVPDSDAIEIEIDGRADARPVPPGEHFVVVRRAGIAPWAAVVHPAQEQQVPSGSIVVRAAMPAERDAAEEICDRLQLDRLVLARRQGRRLGLQGYACGDGFGPAWYGGAEPLARGVAVVLGRTQGVTFDRTRAILAGPSRWPALPAKEGLGASSGGTAKAPADEPRGKKAWYKRAWIWVIVGGVVVAGVTTAAVLGTRDPPGRVLVNSPDWFGE